jgi:hypothetical protein
MNRILGGATMKPILAWCTTLIPLLASSLALALTTSAPQEIPPPGTTTPPGATPCDIGPPYTGSIPAAAAQAGFTHCAANYDFTQTQSFTDSVGTHQWSNLSSWLSCSGSTSAPYLWRYLGSVVCDTTHQNITTDSGVQVFTMTFSLADDQAGYHDNYLQNVASFASDPANPMPEQFYSEMVTRQVSPNGNCNTYCQVFDYSTFTSVSGNPCFIGKDQEFDDNANATGVGLAPFNYSPACGDSFGNGGGGPTTNNDGPIHTTYGTFGNLVTADNVSGWGACDYWAAGAVSGLPKSAFGSCLTNFNGLGSLNNGVFSISPPANNTAFHGRMYTYINVGQKGNVGTGHWTSTIYTVYIQRFTIWECAGWATGACITTPVITTAP